MGTFGRILGWLLLGVNALFVLALLVCAYSPYLHPAQYPMLSCAGLAFPVFLVSVIAFLVFWLVVRFKYAVLSLAALLCCLPAIRAYIPLNFADDEVPEGAIKFLSYNIMGFEADHPDTSDNPNRILHYLKDCGADIICLQEYISDGRLKQEHIEKVLAAYPYRDYQRVGDRGNRLACYSRFPILSTTPVTYTSDFNGSVVYRLKVGSDTLTVINNHLESNKLTSDDKEIYLRMLKSPETADVKAGSRHLWRKLAEASVIRSHQADTIASLIRRRTTDKIVVCGDFNTSPISYTHRVIADELTDAFTQSGCGLGVSYHRNGFYFRIDNILIGPSLRSYRCTVDRSIKNSDHYPIWCFIGL